MRVIALIVLHGLILHSLSEINAFIHRSPEKAAVDVGGSTAFNCASNVSIFAWHFQTPGSTHSVVVTIGCTIQGTTTCPYAVDTSGAMDCQLIITNASPTCAGMYICQDVTGTSSAKSAMLVVLDSNPSCSANATNATQVDVSRPVTMSCAVTYTSPYLRPHLNWSQPSNTFYSNISYAYSVITETIVLPKILSDDCRLSFIPQTDPPETNPSSETATNVPSYNSICTVPDIFPLYCPLHVNITGAENGSLAINGLILTCNANANPRPSFFEWWLIVNGREPKLLDSTISTVHVFAPGMYVCNVTNDLPGCKNTTASFIVRDEVVSVTTRSTTTTHGASSNHEIFPGFVDIENVICLATKLLWNVNTSDENVLAGSIVVDPHTPHTVAIVLGIVIPLLVIGIIVAVVVVIWMRHRNRESTKPTQPLINGSEQPNNQFGPEYARVNKPASSSNQRQDIHVKDGNQMIYGQLNIADTRRRKPIQTLIEDRPFPYATIVRA